VRGLGLVSVPSPAPLEPQPSPTSSSRLAQPAPGVQVRAATRDDVSAVVAAVSELLRELGSTPPAASAMEAAARTLVDDRQAGALLVAEEQRAIVGVLGASWQTAMHVPGRYAVIQDLWVDRSWRSRAIGGALIDALCELVREQRLARIEVGLPRERFAGIRATQAFYLRNGFEPLGERMRRVLA
jgi:ribosomal protein S18 acetylase RimI-like enzyme